MKEDIFKGRTLLLVTKHGKESVMKEILESELGVNVVVSEDFDTDKFGTFSGEVKRDGNQLEAARKKLLSGMKHYGATLGVGSEGSFGSLPNNPLMPLNTELVVLIDQDNNIEIKGHHSTFNTNSSGESVSSYEEALEFAERIGFPLHGVILRKTKDDKKMYKGIISYDDLEKYFRQLQTWYRKKVYIETDLRAHMNPKRMTAIGKATSDLVKNSLSKCEKCFSPGFSAVDVKKGLVCQLCDLPTDLISKYIFKCQKCAFTKLTDRPDALLKADAGDCAHCNP